MDSPVDLRRLIGLASWLDPQISRDAEHSTRVGRLSMMMGDLMGLDGPMVGLVGLAGLLHDIGKVVVPSTVLLKPGRLDPQELVMVRRHAHAGGELVVRADLGMLGSLLRHHHERWDGGGYPDGLVGAEIPPLARILAVADAYHAMLADRPYRDSLGHRAALRELERGAGSQFDPELVDAVLGSVFPAELRVA